MKKSISLLLVLVITLSTNSFVYANSYSEIQVSKESIRAKNVLNQ